MASMELDNTGGLPSPPLRSSSFSGSKPKGILKRPSNDGQRDHKSLLWNEENLAVNELAKDSTMKINEPKTPYVRYNAETDEVMDLDKIPGFELGRAEDQPEPPSPTRSASNDGSNSNPTSRRGSEASDKMVKVEAPGPLSEDDDNDELADEETLEHRKKFAAARGSHYKNEAEAMKRAQALLDDEDESSGPDSGRPVPPLPTAGKLNGN